MGASDDGCRFEFEVGVLEALIVEGAVDGSGFGYDVGKTETVEMSVGKSEGDELRFKVLGAADDEEVGIELKGLVLEMTVGTEDGKVVGTPLIGNDDGSIVGDEEVDTVRFDDVRKVSDRVGERLFDGINPAVLGCADGSEVCNGDGFRTCDGSMDGSGES